jgi:hypothetical protein
VLIIGNEKDDIHLFLEKDDDEILTFSISGHVQSLNTM